MKYSFLVKVSFSLGVSGCFLVVLRSIDVVFCKFFWVFIMVARFSVMWWFLGVVM